MEKVKVTEPPPQPQVFLQTLNYDYQLSPKILNYPSAPTFRSLDSRRVCYCVSDALPPSIFTALKDHLVHASTNYFSEHAYTDGFTGEPATPYFSYVMPLPKIRDASSTTFISSLVSQIYSVCLPSVGSKLSTCKHVEFWCHSRPHVSGHQFHFDSDNEGVGELKHPICTAVVYLTDVGGPTCVTSLKLNSAQSPRRSFLCYPRENSLVCLDGSVLHGVIPGKGVPEDASKRRVTLMFAFWDDVSTAM